MMQFKDFPALTAELAFGLIDALNADGVRARFGASNQSCSTYVEVTVEDDDLDLYETVKVRFSNHDDRHGSDCTIRIDDHVITVNDDCGEYSHTEIDPAAFSSLIAAGKERAMVLRAKIIEEARNG